jgi:hypothetical protein
MSACLNLQCVYEKLTAVQSSATVAALGEEFFGEAGGVEATSSMEIAAYDAGMYVCMW